MVTLYDKESVEKRLQEVLPTIIDEFAALYGEKFRDVIEKRIAETKIVQYNEPRAVKSYITAQISKLNEHLTSPFLEEAGIKTEGIEPKEIMKKLLGDSDFSYTYSNIDAFSEEVEQRKEIPPYLIRKRCEVLQAFGIPATPDNYLQVIQSAEVQALMPQIRSVYQLKKKYEAIVLQKKEEFAPIRNKAEAELEQKRTIDREAEAAFLSEIATRYPEKIKDASDMKHGYHTEGALYCDGIDTEGAITAFSEESLRKLQEGKNSFRKGRIRERQIEYLRKKGVPITPSNYDEVIQTEACRKVIPTYDEIKEVETLRGGYLQEYYKRVAKEVPSYRELHEKYPEDEQLNYEGFVKNMEHGLNCNLCNEKDGHIDNTLAFSMLGMLEGYQDVVLIHELVHAIEMSVGPDGVARCGLQKIDSNENRSLNETKTQMIAMVIAERLHEKGMFLFEEPETAKIRGGTSYEKEELLVKGLMANLWKEVLEVGMTGDMESFLRKVGKKNFEKLSTAVEEHSNISDFQLLAAHKSNDPNHPISRKRRRLFDISKEAVSQMEQQAFGTLSGPER